MARAVLATTVLGVLIPSCSDEEPDAVGGMCGPEEVPLVAFDRNPEGYGPGGAEVVVRQPDGTEEVVSGDAVATDPDLSPTGDDVVVVRADGDYESAGPGATRLEIVGVTRSSELRPLTEGVVAEPRVFEPSWSPDGAQVAFSTRDDDPVRRRLAILPVAGGEATALTSGDDGDDHDPAWSPDGSQLAFVRWTPPGYQYDPAQDVSASVWVVDADGTGERRVADLPDDDLVGIWTLDWHPSQPVLLASSFGAESGRIWSVDLDSGAVAEIAGRGTLARWTDGGAVVHYTGPGTSWDLRLSRLDGGELTEVADLGHEDYLYGYFGLSVGPCS